MELLGVRNAPADYCNGESLFVPSRSVKTVSCGWNDCAWLLDDAYVVFGTASNWRWGLEVLDASYRKHAGRDQVLAGNATELAALAQEFSRFLAR
jgi:membrane-anchored protein YejM (alkaline phosphatase superfamily)